MVAVTKRRVVFIDREPAVLDALRRSLFRIRDQWEMEFFSDYAEAREALMSRPARLVVSDLGEQGGGPGLALLREIAQCSPMTVRVALTGDVTGVTALEAIGVTHQYLSKPINIDGIRVILKSAFEIQAILGRESVSRVLAQLERIPSLPESFRKLTQVLDDPDSDLSEAVVIIESDPGLVSGILKIVNSAYFGLLRNVNQIDDAVSVIGIDMLKAMVLNDKLFESMSFTAACVPTAEAMRLHGLHAAARAKNLARSLRLPREQQSALYMTALIHDFGQLIMLSAFGADYETMFLEAESEEALCAAEISEFGTSHCTIGAYLFGLWGLDREVVQAIAHHHNPLKRRAPESFGQAVIFGVTAISTPGASDGDSIAAYRAELEESDSAEIAEYAAALAQEVLC